MLFVYVENAGRSQIAEAFKRECGAGKIVASSAVNKPVDRVNPTEMNGLKETASIL
jgi:protein-tyrosine-phosphatase